MSWEFEQKFTSEIETADKYEVIWSGRDVWVFNQYDGEPDPSWGTEFRNSDFSQDPEGEVMSINRQLSLTIYNFWDHSNGNTSNRNEVIFNDGTKSVYHPTWASSDYERLSYHFYFDNNIHEVTKSRIDLLVCTPDSVVAEDKAPDTSYNENISAAKWYDRIYLLNGSNILEFDIESRLIISDLDQLRGWKTTIPGSIVIGTTPQLCQRPVMITPEIPGELITPEVPGELITPEIPGELITPEIPGELISPATEGTLIKAAVEAVPVGGDIIVGFYPDTPNAQENGVWVEELVFDKPQQQSSLYGIVAKAWVDIYRDWTGAKSEYYLQQIGYPISEWRAWAGLYDTRHSTWEETDLPIPFCIVSTPLVKDQDGLYQWVFEYGGITHDDYLGGVEFNGESPRIHIRREFVNDPSFTLSDADDEYFNYGNVSGVGFWKYTVQVAQYKPTRTLNQPWNYWQPSAGIAYRTSKNDSKGPERYAFRAADDERYNQLAEAGIAALGFTPFYKTTTYHVHNSAVVTRFRDDWINHNGKALCIWVDDPTYDGPSTNGNISNNDPQLVSDPSLHPGFWVWFEAETPYNEKEIAAQPAVYDPPPTPAVYGPPTPAVYGPSTPAVWETEPIPAVYGPPTPAVYGPPSDNSISVSISPNSNLCAANGKLYYTTKEYHPDNQQQWLMIYNITTDAWSYILLPGRHQDEKRHIVDGLDGSIWITNRNNHGVIRVDTTTDSVLATVRVNRHPYWLAANQSKEVYVASAHGDTVTRIYADPDLAPSYASVSNLAESDAVNGFVSATGFKAVKTTDITNGMVSVINQSTNAYTNMFDAKCYGENQEGTMGDDGQGYMWFATDKHFGRINKSTKDLKTTYKKEDATPTPKDITANIGMIPVGATVNVLETGGTGDDACTTDMAIKKSLVTPSFTTSKWNGSSVVTYDVKPYLVMIVGSELQCYRLTNFVRKNLYKHRGTAMIATGAQQYYGEGD